MSEPIDRPSCGSCNCYLPDAAQLLRGFCQCLPPVPIVVAAPGPSGQGLLAVFPPVGADGFCHQWRPRQAANEPVGPPRPLQELQHGP